MRVTIGQKKPITKPNPIKKKVKTAKHLLRIRSKPILTLPEVALTGMFISKPIIPLAYLLGRTTLNWSVRKKLIQLKKNDREAYYAACGKVPYSWLDVTALETIAAVAATTVEVAHSMKSGQFMRRRFEGKEKTNPWTMGHVKENITGIGRSRKLFQFLTHYTTSHPRPYDLRAVTKRFDQLSKKYPNTMKRLLNPQSRQIELDYIDQVPDPQINELRMIYEIMEFEKTDGQSHQPLAREKQDLQSKRLGK